jgi:hypothetical protein
MVGWKSTSVDVKEAGLSKFAMPQNSHWKFSILANPSRRASARIADLQETSSRHPYIGEQYPCEKEGS